MRIFLCGGGSGEKTILANKKLDEVINHNRPILYVPLAMDATKHPYDECYEWVKKELSNVDVPSIEMVKSFRELSEKKLDDYSAIFIGGGNTYSLLKGLKESNSLEKIRDFINNDGVVFGGSAGAIIFGKDIDCCGCMDNNDVELKDTSGLDILNGISLFCHYTNKKSKLSEEENKIRMDGFTNYLLDYSLNRETVLGLPEEDTIFIDNDKIEIIGTKPYYKFTNGNVEEKNINFTRQK